MRMMLSGAVLLLAAACNQSAPRQDANAEGCARTAMHAVAWSNPSAPDTVSARAEGPNCAQAVVTLVVRNAAGDPLWTLASTYQEMTIGGRGSGEVTPVSNEDMDRFLDGWANVTLNHSSDLPAWPAGDATLGDAVDGMAYYTDFERETYEGLRARNLPQLCYAAAVEASQCLVIDPASNAPIKMVAFGV